MTELDIYHNNMLSFKIDLISGRILEYSNIYKHEEVRGRV